MIQEWNGFKKGVWETDINVRDFIQTNYTLLIEKLTMQVYLMRTLLK